MNFVKAIIGCAVWFLTCWFIIKFMGINGGED